MYLALTFTGFFAHSFGVSIGNFKQWNDNTIQKLPEINTYVESPLPHHKS